MRSVVAMVSALVVSVTVGLAGEWNVDPVHSSVGFSVRHLMISNVKGGFGKFSGTAKYDPAVPGGLVIEGTVEAASIDTGNGMRDKDLRSESFLDVAKYPLITFKSTALKKEADGRTTLTGDLGLHGVTNSVTFELRGLAAPVAFMGTRVGMSLIGQIPRDKFGLTYNKALETGGVVVGNEVTLSADIEIVERVAPAPAK